jgi:hypothetical protein
MWAMLQQDEPDDYVVATGVTWSIRDFLDRAFSRVGIDDWSGYVRQDKRFFRPAEVDLLVGDASKARAKLGWAPEVDLDGLVDRMVRHDLEIEARKAGVASPRRLFGAVSLRSVNRLPRRRAAAARDDGTTMFLCRARHCAQQWQRSGKASARFRAA